MFFRPVQCHALMVDGIAFGIEYNCFYFFDTMWGMSKENVKDTLSKVSAIEPAYKRSSLIPNESELKSFTVNGRLVERDGFDFVCTGIFGNNVVFHFEFEKDKLAAIYLDYELSSLGVLQQYKMSVGFSSDFHRLLSDMNMKKMDSQNSLVSIYKGRGFYAASGTSFSNALWPETTEMTLERLTTATRGILVAYDARRLKQSSKKAQGQMPPARQREGRGAGMDERINDYRQNILQLLN